MPSPVGPPASNPSPELSDAGAPQTATAKPAQPGWRRPVVFVPVVAVLVALGVLGLFLRPATTSETAAPSAAAQPTPTAEPDLPPATGPFYQQAGPPAGSPLEAVEAQQVRISRDLVGTSFNKGLVGISLEATDLRDPTLSGSNASLVTLLNDVDQPVLRFGGNAVDRRFFWTSSGEPAPASYQGDKAHPVRAVGPADLSRVKTLLDAVNGTISLTLDLGHYDPSRAADMAGHAARIFGPRLLSLTVGNEPNGFGTNGVRPGGYSTSQYVKELKAYADAIHAVAPDVPISGPGAYDQKWWQPFIDADLPQKKILTFHYYPMYSCDGKVDPLASPTIANIMSPLMHTRAEDYQKAALEAGQKAGLEVWLPETGIAACAGSNETSRTHASALWSADFAMNAAQLGITRIGFHSSLLTCKGGPPMSAICTGGPYLKSDGVFSARANFFGMSMVAELEGGKFLKTDSKGGGLSFAYALQNSDGSTTVVLINENNPEKAAQTAVSISLPGKPRTGTMSQLTGPSYAAEDSTLIDGAKSGPTPPAKRATVEGFRPGSSDQTFKLTAGTVTVLTFTY